MATITYNNAGNNLTPVRFCDIDGSGDILHGYEAFTDATKLGLDWSPGNTAAANSYGITSNTYQADTINDTYFYNSTETAFYLELDTAIAGDFDVSVHASCSDNTNDSKSSLMAYESAGNWMAMECKYGGGGFNYQKTISGTSSFSATAAAITDAHLRLKRSGNDFSAYYSTDNKSTWTLMTTQTIAAFGSIKIRLTYQNTSGGDVTFTFDDLVFTDGCPVDAEFKINDSGDTKIDAGEGWNIDKGTITAVTTGTLTVKEEVNDTGTFGSYGTDSAWTTPGSSGNYPHDSETGRYWWPYFTLSGDAVTFTSLTADTASTDVTPPSATTSAAAYESPETGFSNIITPCTNGADTGGSGYAGTNPGYRNSSDGLFYYLQSDGSYSTDETFANLALFGDASEELIVLQQDTAATIDRARLTGWDNAGNHSTRTDLVLTDLDRTLPDASDVRDGTDRGDGTLGTLDLPAVEDVEAGVVYDNTTKTGTYDPTVDDVWPAAWDVEDGVIYGPTGADYTGTFAVPTEAQVEDGVGFGADGTEFTGSLSVTEVGAATLALSSVADGAVTLDITAENESDTITVYYRTASGTWTAFGTTRTGSGSLTITGLTNKTAYTFIAQATRASCLSPASNAVVAVPTDGSEPLHDRLVDSLAALITAEGLTDYEGTEFSVDTEFPPHLSESEVRRTIFVLPDNLNPRPMPTATVDEELGVTVIIAEQSEADGQMSNRNSLLNSITRLVMANPRPVPGIYLNPEPFAPATIFTLEELRNYRFFTPLSVRYKARTNRS